MWKVKEGDSAIREIHTVYLIHFERPYKHAKHYCGVTAGDVNRRMAQHENGTGANLMRVIRKAGIGWVIARVWENVPRSMERRIKNRGGLAKVCPICKEAASCIR